MNAAETAAQATTAAPRAPARLTAAFTDTARLLAIVSALLLVFGLTTDSFFSVRTVQAIAHQIPALLVGAVAMTFVLVMGQIDLSIGSTLALAGAVIGTTMVQAGWPLPLAVLAALATGAGVGAINGLIMVRWRLPSFIVTLGMLEMARGGTYLVSDSRTQYIGAGIERLGEARLLALPLPFILALVVVVLAHAVLTRTVFGRYLVAVGTNEEVVRLAGIPTARLRVVTFTLAGALAGLAAVIHTARLGAADPNAGTGFELSAIAAAVIGGTSLMGGRGTVIGTGLGVLFIAILDAGLAQLGAAEPVKRLITGAVIVAAVILDNRRRRATHAR